MFYIVPLGNPGSMYEYTRHNIGWLVLDQCLAAWGLPLAIKQTASLARITSGRVGGNEVTVVYPETYMNHSGRAVKKIITSGELPRLIVVYDDVDLPFGTIKVATGRGSGGHNGVASVITEMGSKDFLRIRVGIAPIHDETGAAVRPHADRLANYVLGKFTADEQAQLPELASRVQKSLELVMSDGTAAAMNRYNAARA
jgi:PTH1 family peptidyl-tRNA hydrolase